MAILRQLHLTDNVRSFCIIFWRISHYKTNCNEKLVVVILHLRSDNQTFASRCCNYLFMWKRLFTSLDHCFLVPRFFYSFAFHSLLLAHRGIICLIFLVNKKFFQIGHSKEILRPRDTHIDNITYMNGYKDNATLDFYFQPLAQLS